MYIQSNIKVYIPKGINSESPLSFFLGSTGGLEEPEFSIKSYLNIIYNDGNFLNAIYYILVEKDGFCEEGADCYYPDFYSPDLNDHFDGVRFEIGGLSKKEYQVEVDEITCFNSFKKACGRFLELHPEQVYKDFISQILDNWKPLNRVDK